MPIEIHELEILAPDAEAGAGGAGGAGGAAAEGGRRPAQDPGEQLRLWHRELRARADRLVAD